MEDNDYQRKSYQFLDMFIYVIKNFQFAKLFDISIILNHNGRFGQQNFVLERHHI